MNLRGTRALPSGRLAVGLLASGLLAVGLLAGSAVRAWATDSFEPNDIPEQAHTLTSGVSIESWISSAGDTDWYHFTADAGGAFIFLTSLPADYDMSLWYLDPSSSSLDSIAVSQREEMLDEELTGILNNPGDYFLHIYGWKGAFNPDDSYLLVATFPGGGGGNDPPFVTVISPNGGETLEGGSTENITYAATDPNGDDLEIKLEFSTNGGISWTQIADGQPNTGSHAWSVPNTATTQGRVRVTANDGQAPASDASNGSFTITTVGPPVVSLLSPNGGEILTAGAIHDITYAATGGAGPLEIDLELSTDGGSTFSPIASGLANTSTHAWSVPDLETTQGRVRITAADGENSATDVSAGNFTITPGPAGGNVVMIGSGSGNSGETVTVPLSLDNETAMRGLQLEIAFNGAVASFVTAAPTGRGAALDVEFRTVANGRIRGVLHFDQSLGPGTGPIANLTFRLAGNEGGQTTLTPEHLVFSDPDAQPADVTGQAGVLTVTGGPTEAPDVDIAVLKNPGRERTLQVYVTVVNGSGNLPFLTIGGTEATPTALGNGVFLATRAFANGTNNVVVQAADTNGAGTGTDEITVGF